MSVSGNEIGDLLVDIGIITAEELASALEEQARSGDRLTLILDRLGLVTYHQLKDSLELQFGVNFISLSKNVPALEVADLVTYETKQKYKLIPVANNGTQFTVAMVNPDDVMALEALRVELRSGHMKKLVCTADEFEYCMKELYQPPALVVEAEISAPVMAETSDTNALTSAESLISAGAVTVPLTESNSGRSESLSEEFTLPASVIAQANALSSKSTRVPAKKHLQSLFGDDDDEDDFSASPAKTAVEETLAKTTELSVEARAVETLDFTSVLERVVDQVVGSIAEPLAPLHNTNEASAETVAQVIASDDIQPLVEPQERLFEPVMPAPEPEVVEQTPVPEIIVEAPLVVPDVVPAVVPDIAVTAPIIEPTTSRVELAEIAMEAALANVTNHIIETSQVLTADANRLLLEDVVESELGGSEEETDIHRMKEAQNASVMLLAHEIIGKATQKRCSDIHLEPDVSGVALRYFLHGELLADCMLPLEIHGALVGSYKVIAGLNPQELEKPQDKKFTTRVEDDEVELRITTIPTDNGEMVAISMRFTDPNSAGAIAQAKMANLSE